MLFYAVAFTHDKNSTTPNVDVRNNIFFFSKKKNDKDTFYVINISGAELYEHPSLDSKVIKKIKAGEKVIADEILKTDQLRKIGNEFYLAGAFVRVRNKSFSGYIFSSDLTKIRPTLNAVYEGIMLPDILGKEKSKRTEKRIERFDDTEYEIEDEITEYENGTYTYTAFDGCFDHVYVYRNMTLGEVYHHLTLKNVMIDVTGGASDVVIPMFKEKKGNEYLFEDEGATQNLKIIENEDGTFTVSSYDCT